MISRRRMNFLNLLDLSKAQLTEIFLLSDIISGEKHYLDRKTIILFFPETSVRTRITFEKGIHELGGQTILFPSSTLNKKEELRDVIGYIENWADLIIIRYPDQNKINKIAQFAHKPIINAMTAENHPCEILSDVYSIRKRRNNFHSLNYTFVGPKGNILQSWVNIAKVLNLNLVHIAQQSERIEPDNRNYRLESKIEKILPVTDVLLTDQLPDQYKTIDYFTDFQITKEHIDMLPKNTMINPCPPFYRGEEISSEVIDSEKFVGYEFKRNLLEVQKAIIKYCLEN